MSHSWKYISSQCQYERTNIEAGTPTADVWWMCDVVVPLITFVPLLIAKGVLKWILRKTSEAKFNFLFHSDEDRFQFQPSITLPQIPHHTDTDRQKFPEDMRSPPLSFLRSVFVRMKERKRDVVYITDHNAITYCMLLQRALKCELFTKKLDLYCHNYTALTLKMFQFCKGAAPCLETCDITTFYICMPS